MVWGILHGKDHGNAVSRARVCVRARCFDFGMRPSPRLGSSQSGLPSCLRPCSTNALAPRAHRSGSFGLVLCLALLVARGISVHGPWLVLSHIIHAVIVTCTRFLAQPDPCPIPYPTRMHSTVLNLLLTSQPNQNMCEIGEQGRMSQAAHEPRVRTKPKCGVLARCTRGRKGLARSAWFFCNSLPLTHEIHPKIA
jgi:hypothetical protein